MVSTPRLVIAAPASGSGKTTVATGLLAALRVQGHRVAPFKVGPDYIDPGYHGMAAGRPGRNLDPVLVGESRIGPLFAHGAAGAEIAVVEGVMGLFDGRADSPAGSTAHVAQLLDAPVVLVVDARGQGRSLAALLHGFRGYDPTVRLAAVVLNQVGSARHEQVLREACAEIGLPVLGAVPRGAEVALPSRHLGLVPAVEHGEPARHAVAAMADLITRSVDLDAVLRLAATAGPAPWSPWDPVTEVGGAGPGRPVVAVAGGPAFTFGYAEHGELLTAAGADVVTLDPVRDEPLPTGVAALLLPGGFPEQHTEALSANTRMRDAVAEFARSGGIVQAECGGLLYLLDELRGRPMCGVLPGTADLAPALTLGYRDAVAATDSVTHRVGERRTGHEFHRTSITGAGRGEPAWHWRDHDGHPIREGFVTGNVHASYLHTHPAGHPETTARLVHAAGGRP
ncbi:MAG TPA: cobyrinate a,c-diamide synthase [Pseudonocardiaceae bacterium]|nr:cobyrinate a,c-diamide synthase [Pseudonocardiaceae bacterium]